MSREAPAFFAPRRQVYASGDSDSVLVLREDQARIIPLNAVLAHVLQLCVGCRTLEDHAARIAGAFRVDAPGTVLNHLRCLLAAGLLAEGPAQTGANSRWTMKKDGEVSTVGIPTADRPDVLRRCLDTLHEHCRLHSRRPRLVVVDGSGSAECRTANKAVVSRFCRAGGYDGSYVGPDEAAEIQRPLLMAGVDPDLMAFALTPGDIGANRNLLLALTAGENILMIDDDILMRPWAASRSGGDELVMGGHGDPRSTKFYRTRTEALAALDYVPEDLLAAHASVLNASLATVWSGASVTALENSCVHILEALLDSPEDWRIRATFAGIAGDSGCPNTDALLFSSGETKALFMANRDAFECALSTREVARAAARPTVSHHPLCMAGCMGLANRAPLAPFIPAGRNEDGIFGLMLHYLEPQTLVGHLAYGVVHDSNRPSAYIEDPIVGATISEVVFVAIEAATTAGGGTREDRASRLAEHLDDLARMPLHEFRLRITQHMLKQRSYQLTAAAANARNVTEYPDYWRERFLRMQGRLQAALKRGDFFVPVEFRGRDPLDALKHAQVYLARLGGLCRAWKEIWEVCATSLGDAASRTR